MTDKELENKLDEENPNLGIYDYGCLNYSSKSGCTTCDGFGRNTDNKVIVSECYKTKKQMEEDLGLNKDN